ncbi:MAG TPA: NAD(P)-dependent oxidoreductase [Streptosporangiaceae bacterium]|nr:NAD(P)-dependent oxidoreductase [Streptosporangiaceae bacterium]
MTTSGPGRPQRLVVLGASGFLGGHVRQQARAAGLDVITAGRSPLPGSPAHCLVDLAAQDPARLAGTLTTLAPDVVVNCAGATSGPPEALAQVNVTGIYDLVRAMLVAGHPARLVHLGSAAEYGPGQPGTAVAESASPRPASAYGATKLAGTHLVELGRAAGLDAVVLRVFNPVGPGAPDGILPGRLVAEFRRALSEGSEVRLGPLDAVRDFVDARDVADAVIAAALTPLCSEALPGVINVASGQGRPARTLARELAAISGYDGPVHEDHGGSPRSAVPSWQQADIGLARQLLGWQPRRSLVESLADQWVAGGRDVLGRPGGDYGRQVL